MEEIKQLYKKCSNEILCWAQQTSLSNLHDNVNDNNMSAPNTGEVTHRFAAYLPLHFETSSLLCDKRRGIPKPVLGPE